MKVTAVTAETADLVWEVPEDDGDSPITGYIIEKRDISRLSWQEVGQVTELEGVATKLMEGNQYLFRISAVNEIGVSEPCETAEPITAKNPYGEPISDLEKN